MPRARRPVLAATFALAGPTLAACGGGTTTRASGPVGESAASASGAADSGSRVAGPAGPAGVESLIPAGEVLDVADGSTFDLASLTPSDRPVLLWFWAPHCSFCNHEAPEVEAFAEEHADVVSVVGLGTQLDGWVGPFDEGEVLDLARAAVRS